MRFTYHINLDERGEFYADVRNDASDTVFEIGGEQGAALAEMIEDGFMNHGRDVDALENYLRDSGVIGSADELVLA